MADFKKLRVWRKAHALTLNTHHVVGTIRGKEHGPLRNQMVRAAMSVAANIVEGRQQRTEPEFARFLGYSLASTSELEHHLILARDLRTITRADYASTLSQLVDVRKMLHGLIAKLTQSTKTKKTLSKRRSDERNLSNRPSDKRKSE